MKLKNWLFGAAALAMLTACSEHDIAPEGGELDNGKTTFTDGVGYLGISLELPSEPISRAGDNQNNDRFDDGTRDEYNVDKAALLLFAGANENDAKFIGAYEMVPSEAFDQPSNDNITVSFQQAIEVLSKPTINGDENFLWGLAIVNYRNDHFEIASDQTASSTYGDLKINGTEIVRIKNEKAAVEADGDTQAQPAVVATTFNQMRSLISDCKFLNITTTAASGETPATETLKSIFMTNAPLCDSQGTTTALSISRKVQTLAKLDKSKFKDTETEAINDPAGCIFVERAVAKITVTGFPGSATLKHTAVNNADTGVAGTTTTPTQVNIVSVEWMVDNEEQNSFIVRNAKTGDNTAYPFWDYVYNNVYRFVGGASLATTGANGSFDANTAGHQWYRTYWCIDPNYGVNKTFNNQANGNYDSKYKKNSLAQQGETNYTFASNTPIYCHENTFDINHQNYKNTTRVVFKVKYDGTQMYAIRNELSTYYLEDDAKSLIIKWVLASEELNDLVKSLMTAGTTSQNYTVDNLKMTFGLADADDPSDKKTYTKGTYYLKSLEFDDSFYALPGITNKANLTDNQKEEIASTLAEVKDYANSKSDIVAFTDNVCYYAVYLKHFGDTYCPLDETKKGDTVTSIYGTDVNRYTGRYGLVRNNWYDLTVDVINNLGKATVPDGNVETSDDNTVEKYFLSARVHVLSWARRTQHTSF